MKKLNSLATAIAVVCYIIGLSRADASVTNVLQQINFALTFIEQGPTNHPATNITVITADKFRVVTKDIIAALGQATSNTFSANAKLVRLININTNDSTTIIQVRDGTNRFDVTAFFKGSFTTNEVRALKYNSTTHILSGARYGILHLDVTNAEPYSLTASLKVTGVATTTHTDIVKNQVIIGVEEIQATVSGTGVDTHGVEALVSGTVSILGRTTVVE